MKVTETIALEANDQKEYSLKTKQLKRKIKSGEVTVKDKRRKKWNKNILKRGLMYIGHLPHGFYEDELRAYFKQFGPITNVKVCRSKQTGNSKGFGYVEFVHPEVAKIAAETMNNYIMFKKKLIAEFVPQEKRPKCIFRGKQTANPETAKTRRERIVALKNRQINEQDHAKKCQKSLRKLQQKIATLNNLGINYEIEPVDVPENLNENVSVETKSNVDNSRGDAIKVSHVKLKKGGKEKPAKIALKRKIKAAKIVKQ